MYTKNESNLAILRFKFSVPLQPQYHNGTISFPFRGVPPLSLLAKSALGTRKGLSEFYSKSPLADFAESSYERLEAQPTPLRA